MSSRLGLSLLAIAVALLATVSCSSSSGAPATATAPALTPTDAPATPTPPSLVPSPATATPAAYSTAQAVLGAIEWASAIDPATNVPTERVSAFFTDTQTIYAVVPVLRLAAGTVVSASWTYNDTSMDGLTSRVTAATTYTNAWLEFHIARGASEPWPDGTYQVTILVGGEAALTAEVEVRERDA